MAYPNIYNGVSGVRRDQKIFVGVSGGVRNVIKAYVGVSGTPRLCFTGDFWRIDGLAVSACIAAYRFKGASSASAALNDVVPGHTNTNLTNYNTTPWYSDSGFGVDIGYNRYLDNSTVRNGGIKSWVIKISNGNFGTGGACPLCGIGDSGPAVWMSTPYAVRSFDYWNNYGKIGKTHGNGTSTDYDAQWGMTPYNVMVGSGTYNDGVFGWSMNSAGNGETVYRNGNVISMDRAYGKDDNNYTGLPWTGYISASVPKLICGYNYGDGVRSKWDDIDWHSYVYGFRVQYAAFYNVTLSREQHIAIMNKMNAM